MPQASDELRKKWMNDNDDNIESKALDYLYFHGWSLTKDWCWSHHDVNAILDNNSYSAIEFLIDEMDYGGVIH